MGLGFKQCGPERIKEPRQLAVFKKVSEPQIKVEDDFSHKQPLVAVRVMSSKCVSLPSKHDSTSPKGTVLNFSTQSPNPPQVLNPNSLIQTPKPTPTKPRALGPQKLHHESESQILKALASSVPGMLRQSCTRTLLAPLIGDICSLILGT